MAQTLPRTLIPTTKSAAAASAASASSASSPFSYFSTDVFPKFKSTTNFIAAYPTHYYYYYYSTQSQLPDVGEAEALAVRRIEDAIHRIIVKQSTPDWLPFVPGASYWVPPKRRNYGIAQLVNKIVNSLSDDEVMSLTTSRGWPSSAFYIPPDASSDRVEAVETSSSASLSEGEEG